MNNIEKCIIQMINKKALDSYGKMTVEEINKIYDYIWQTFNVKIDKRIIVSIRSAYMTNYIISRFYRLQKYSKDLIEKYPTTSVVKLSEQYDIHPMSIMRFIKNNNNSPYDYNLKQLALAKKYDVDNKLIMKNAIDFEKKIELLLKERNISFRTQDMLAKEQIKLYGKAIATPDFVIDSDLVINDVKINWIDAKNYYGSNIPFIVTKIKKQIKKYTQMYSTGCIIFSLGFNPILHFPKVVLLSYDQIKIYSIIL